MLVKNWMTEQVITVSPNESMQNAAKLMGASHPRSTGDEK